MTATSQNLTRTVDGRLVPAAGSWAFEAGNSSVEFSVKHMMISKVRGTFREFSGAIEVAEDPLASMVSVRIETASLDTGLEYRDKDLRGKDFLDVEKHPQLTFTSTTLSPDGDGWRLGGDLTIAGQTRPVVLAFEFHGAAVDPWGNQKAAFSATTSLDREEWGLTYNQALESGGVLIGSKINIEMEIQAKPVPA